MRVTIVPTEFNTQSLYRTFIPPAQAGYRVVTDTNLRDYADDFPSIAQVVAALSTPEGVLDTLKTHTPDLYHELFLDDILDIAIGHPQTATTTYKVFVGTVGGYFEIVDRVTELRSMYETLIMVRPDLQAEAEAKVRQIWSELSDQPFPGINDLPSA